MNQLDFAEMAKPTESGDGSTRMFEDAYLEIIGREPGNQSTTEGSVGDSELDEGTESGTSGRGAESSTAPEIPRSKAEPQIIQNNSDSTPAESQIYLPQLEIDTGSEPTRPNGR